MAAGGGAILGWALKELYSFHKKTDSELKHALDKLKETIQQNTMAVVKLTVEMEHLQKRTEVIPELSKDLSALGEKVRSMGKTQRNGSQSQPADEW